jgi:hypothetical protein
MPFFKCIFEVMFSEGAQHRLQFCLDRLICVKMLAFSFSFKWGNRKVGWVRDDSHVVFGQKFRGEKGNVGWCVAVMQQPVLLLPKFETESSHIFKKSP